MLYFKISFYLLFFYILIKLNNKMENRIKFNEKNEKLNKSIKFLFGFLSLIYLILFKTRNNYIIENLVLIYILVKISIIDYKLMIIPNELNISIGILSIFTQIKKVIIEENFISLINSLKAILFILFIFSILFLIKKDSIGHGDFKLFISLSLNFSLEKIVSIFLLSFTIGSIVCMILLVIKRLNKKSKIPFAPFISIATFFSISIDLKEIII